MTHLSARGTSSVEDVEAEVADGWYIPVFSHGQVDYRSGTAAFDFPEAVPRSAGETGEPHQGARIRLPIPGLLNAIRMMAVDVAETVTLCDKQSQRLPVRHAAPLTALHAVGITEMVAS
jgi:predicted Zn-dependent protease